jgi:hypothetical protein
VFAHETRRIDVERSGWSLHGGIVLDEDARKPTASKGAPATCGKSA